VGREILHGKGNVLSSVIAVVLDEIAVLLALSVVGNNPLAALHHARPSVQGISQRDLSKD